MAKHRQEMRTGVQRLPLRRLLSDPKEISTPAAGTSSTCARMRTKPPPRNRLSSRGRTAAPSSRRYIKDSVVSRSGTSASKTCQNLGCDKQCGGCDSCEACDASAITSSCNAALMYPAAVFAYDQFRKDEDDYAELKDAPSKKAHSCAPGGSQRTKRMTRSPTLPQVTRTNARLRVR